MPEMGRLGIFLSRTQKESDEGGKHPQSEVVGPVPDPSSTGRRSFPWHQSFCQVKGKGSWTLAIALL